MRMDTTGEKALLEKIRKSKVQVINEDFTLGHTQPYAYAPEYVARSGRMSEPINLRNVRGIIEDAMREMDEDDDASGTRDARSD